MTGVRLPLLTFLCCLGCTWALSNVALHKPATQSTYYPFYGNPDKVVDGDKRTYIAYCTATLAGNKDPNRWWRVDLLGDFKIQSLVITNRGDCCGNRLFNFDIYVTKSRFNPFTETPAISERCHNQTAPVRQGATVTFNCSQPIVGRYVTLVAHGSRYPLNFCELEVLGDPVGKGQYSYDVAFQKPATQSTYQLRLGKPQNVVDGDLRTRIVFCTTTAVVDTNPNRWLRVDLLGDHKVESIIVTNRGDCCADRLINFDVYLTDSLFNPFTVTPADSHKCLHRTESIPIRATLRLDCDKQVTGRYLTLVQRHKNPLSFCELKVIGAPTGPVLTNVARNKTVTMSSVLGHLGRPYRVTDGDKTGHVSYCSTTAMGDTKPVRWWRIDLGNRSTVELVTIQNRGDCCGDRLKGFDVYVTDDEIQNFTRPDISKRCARHDGAAVHGEIVDLYCSKPVSGRYVYLFVDGSRLPVTVCEIEVYGRPGGPLVRPPTDWLDEKCSKDSDCKANDTVCFKEKCLCKPGLYFSVGSETCVKTCKASDLQSTYTVYPDSRLRKPKHGKEVEVSAEKCQEICSDYNKKGNQCRSFSRKYKGNKTKCFLHEVTSAEDPKNFKAESKGYNHYQRQCA